MKLSQLEAEVIQGGGERLIIPHAGWTEILRSREIDGIPVAPSVADLREFCSKHSAHFALALIRAGKSWLPLPLLRISGGLARVQIEQVTCDACGWSGAIANPTEPTLYFGPGRFEALRAAWTLPREECPECGGPLPRFAAWTEGARA